MPLPMTRESKNKGTDREVASHFIVWKDQFKIKEFDLEMVEEVPSFDFIAH